MQKQTEAPTHEQTVAQLEEHFLVLHGMILNLDDEISEMNRRRSDLFNQMHDLACLITKMKKEA